eukprot:9554-Heterococcus_DN1.PRE.10
MFTSYATIIKAPETLSNKESIVVYSNSKDHKKLDALHNNTRFCTKLATLAANTVVEWSDCTFINFAVHPIIETEAVTVKHCDAQAINKHGTAHAATTCGSHNKKRAVLTLLEHTKLSQYELTYDQTVRLGVLLAETLGAH